MKAIYKTVILKLSGEALVDSADKTILDQKKLSAIADEVAKAAELGVHIGVVVGAGNIWRGRLAEKVGIEQATGDYMAESSIGSAAICSLAFLPRWLWFSSPTDGTSLLDMRHVALLGASGNIGSQSLDVFSSDRSSFELDAISVGHHVEKIPAILSAFPMVRFVCVKEQADALALSKDHPDIKVSWGNEGLIGLLKGCGCDMVENALVGFSGLMVTKHFDQFVNPGVHIPEMITAKTHIDDSMVKDAPNEIEAAKLISDFIGDAVIVSHNAPFDVGFLNAMRAKAGMRSVTNPVVDTLALSHYLFPEAARHTLGALSRNLNLDVYDENDAHRADYDAEALNNVWQVIIPILTKENEHLTQADLAHLISTNQNIFKHLRSYHMVALAKNQAGLKALYRLISDSHTTFLSAGSLPKISREELIQYRENLLFGSACFNSEVFEIACNKREEELKQAMSFYDYIEIQPPENYSWLVNMHELDQDRLMSVFGNLAERKGGCFR